MATVTPPPPPDLPSFNLSSIIQGFASFRPDILDILYQPSDMDPEYIGPIPTNAETTLAALAALKLYMDSRY